MDLLKIIKKTGLSEKEAKIYLTLLQLHEALPSTISKKSGIKRPTTYVVLEQLLNKGMVSHSKKGPYLYYRALSPKIFVEEQNDKISELRSALPELQKLHEKYATTPQMTVYEGTDGLIKVMEDTLTTKTEILVWANVGIAVEALKDYYPLYVKKKVARKIWVRGVGPYNKMALRFKKFGKEELREIYLIPQKKFPFKNEINIYDDKVAIMSHEDRVGVIIQNKNIADTQRIIFELGFEYAKLLEKGVLSEEDKLYLEA